MQHAENRLEVYIACAPGYLNIYKGLGAVYVIHSKTGNVSF